jgi:hypothetical protein
VGTFRPKSFSWLAPYRLTKAHTGTAAVFVNEFDAGVFKGASNDLKGGTPRLCHSRLELMNGHLAYTRSRCKILLIPCEKTSRCPAL